MKFRAGRMATGLSTPGASGFRSSFEFSDMDVVFPNEKTAILTYRVKLAVATRGNGKPSVQQMNDTSTWIQAGKQWKCVMHTETPAKGE